MRFYKKTIIYREDGKPYLIRYSLFSCHWFAVKIHHIMLSDYDCLHDHPWNFISIILKGGYTEIRKRFVAGWKEDDFGNGNLFIGHENYSTLYKPGSVLYRKATDAHALYLPEGKTAWTFVITFKKTRPWGFHTLTGWVPWRKYDTKQNCE